MDKKAMFVGTQSICPTKCCQMLDKTLSNLTNLTKLCRIAHFVKLASRTASHRGRRRGPAAGTAARRPSRAVPRRRPGCLATNPPRASVGDTTADRQNFGKMLLVFGCIGTDFCKKIRVFQHFSKSTRLSS